MKQFWVTFFGSVIGVIFGAIFVGFLGLFAIGALIGALIASSDPDMQAQSQGPVILELDLRVDRLDQPSSSFFALNFKSVLFSIHDVNHFNRFDVF